MTSPPPEDPATEVTEGHDAPDLRTIVEEISLGVGRLRAFAKRARAKDPGASPAAASSPARVDSRLQQMEARVRAQSEALKRNQALWGKILRKEGVQWAHEWEEDRLARRLSRLADSGRPVFVGPWRGEVGIELLYWIPFLSWVYANTPIAPERTVIVSRGGVDSWYRGIGASYLDVLDVISPDEFMQASVTAKKQRQVSGFDRTFMRLVQAKQDNRALLLLHPSLMYRLFDPYWRGEVPASLVEATTRYRPLERPPAPPWRSQLPDEYVAVKFYFGTQFPDTPDNRRFVADTIQQLAERDPVVIVDVNLRLDEHEPLASGGKNVFHLHDLPISPGRNLDVQSQVIAHAKFLVGTYGGIAHVAPFYDVPSMLVYSNDAGFFRHHVELAQRVFRRMTNAPFVVLRTNEWSMMRPALRAL